MNSTEKRLIRLNCINRKKFNIFLSNLRYKYITQRQYENNAMKILDEIFDAINQEKFVADFIDDEIGFTKNIFDEK
jgi:hypothetical protein